jgi:hypothetical protein
VARYEIGQPKFVVSEQVVSQLSHHGVGGRWLVNRITAVLFRTAVILLNLSRLALTLAAELMVGLAIPSTGSASARRGSARRSSKTRCMGLVQFPDLHKMTARIEIVGGFADVKEIADMLEKWSDFSNWLGNRNPSLFLPPK